MAELVLYALPKMIAEVCIDEQNRNQPEMVQGLRHMRESMSFRRYHYG